VLNNRTLAPTVSIVAHWLASRISRLLTKLHTLSLSNTKMTDKGLEHIKELAELKTLHLKGTKVEIDRRSDRRRGRCACRPTGLLTAV
jgi:hypothetical protein